MLLTNTAINISQDELDLLKVCDFVYFSNSTVLYNAEHKQDLLVINSPSCYAVISPMGGQILEFRPHGQDNWLWLSPLAKFETGQAIRGGIPICLPWFGVNQQQPELPKHGIARTQLWQLTAIEEQNGNTQVVFELHHDGELPELAAEPFYCQLTFDLGRELNLRLKLKNCSDKAQQFSWAMHSYFAVEHSVKARVTGLENHAFLDNTEGLQTFQQAGSVVFAGEVDRVYQATEPPQRLVDGEQLEISGFNCPSCIVWNPGALSAMRIADIKTHYSEFICVERGRAFDDSLTLEAGETFHSTMQVKKVA